MKKIVSMILVITMFMAFSNFNIVKADDVPTEYYGVLQELNNLNTDYERYKTNWLGEGPTWYKCFQGDVHNFNLYLTWWFSGYAFKSERYMTMTFDLLAEMMKRKHFRYEFIWDENKSNIYKMVILTIFSGNKEIMTNFNNTASEKLDKFSDMVNETLGRTIEEGWQYVKKFFGDNWAGLLYSTTGDALFSLTNVTPSQIFSTWFKGEAVSALYDLKKSEYEEKYKSIFGKHFDPAGMVKNAMLFLTDGNPVSAVLMDIEFGKALIEASAKSIEEAVNDVEKQLIYEQTRAGLNAHCVATTRLDNRLNSASNKYEVELATKEYFDYLAAEIEKIEKMTTVEALDEYNKQFFEVVTEPIEIMIDEAFTIDMDDIDRISVEDDAGNAANVEYELDEFNRAVITFTDDVISGTAHKLKYWDVKNEKMKVFTFIPKVKISNVAEMSSVKINGKEYPASDIIYVTGEITSIVPTVNKGSSYEITTDEFGNKIITVYAENGISRKSYNVIKKLDSSITNVLETVSLDKESYSRISAEITLSEDCPDDAYIYVASYLDGNMMGIHMVKASDAQDGKIFVDSIFYIDGVNVKIMTQNSAMTPFGGYFEIK